MTSHTRNQINFIQVTRENVDELSELSVHQNERHLICSNPEWLAQAAFVQESSSFGIYRANTPVGLISTIDPRIVEDEDDRDHFQNDCLYVWRLMVDQTHRRDGVGRTAMEFATGFARLLGLRGVSLTTMDRELGNALAFYQSLGFAPTGRRLDGEIELVLRTGG